MATKDDDLLREAKERFQRCDDHESETRPLWKEDLRFANGDPDNGYQWPEHLRKSRENDPAGSRPCLTINKVKQHNRQITNDARQNKPAVRVYPVDSGADKETAEILNGIIRHIEANSSADTAYDTAAEFAVDAGIGYWRVVTDYAADDSFDQEIYIKRIKNPLNVFLDPDIQEADGSDARYGFVFEDISKEEFERRYPNAEPVSWESSGDGWLDKDKIRLAEYFKLHEEKDVLVAGPEGPFLLSAITDKELVKAIKADETMQKRDVLRKVGKWYLLAGSQCLEKKDWPGKYIPIVRVVGDEVEIDGKVARKGHTRMMKDAQRMYNYNSSAAIEYGALQTKVPWVAPAEAIVGYEQYWETANSANHAYLPYNAKDDNDQPIPPPVRPLPPTPAQLFLQGMATASEEMKMSSGQYDASLGAKSNETSGRAILARQREGDNATFHFIDNIARAIKYTGKILVDLIPKIYDTERVVRILGEDGSEDEARIDPALKQAFVERKNAMTRKVERIYNPSIGRYDVTVSVGPSYSTKRQEAAAGMIEVARGNPEIWATHGDLIVKSQDWPMADEFAKRSEKMLPPELQDNEESEDIPPQVKAQIEQLQQQSQQLEEALQNAAVEVERLEAERNEKSGDLEVKRVEANTKAYEAITRRLQVLGPLLNPVEVQSLANETKREAMSQPDPGMAPSESMAVPEQAPEMPPDPNMMQPEQPASAGFFTPEQQ